MKFFFEKNKENWVRFELNGTSLNIKKNDGEAVEESFENMQAMSAFFRAEIEILMKEGFAQRLLPEDRIQPDESAKSFFDDTFFNDLKQTYGVKTCSNIGILSGLEERLGGKIPPSLRTFLKFRDSHTFGQFNFGGISFSEDDLTLPNFEESVLVDQKNSQSFELIKNFTGTVQVGKSGPDSYLAVPHEYAPERVEIWQFSSEDYAPKQAIASDLPTFLFAHYLLDSFSGQSDDISPRFSPLKDQVLIEELSSKIGIPSRYESDSKDDFPYSFNRTYWISHLFRQADEVELSDIADTFHVDIHTPQVWEKTRQFRFIKESPTTQLYWLWRLFWFDRTNELNECIELAKNSSSAYIHSAIELIESFQNGRKKVGKIDDIHALRDEWIKLGLDPAESEDNLKAESEASAKIESDLAMAHEAIRTLSDKELYKKAWSYTDQSNIINVWLEHLRHQEEISSESLDRLESQVR